MDRLFNKIMTRSDVRTLTYEVIHNKRYKNINIPLPITNYYSIEDNYALLLFIDSIIKFDLIINQERYVSDYINQLRRLFKRIDNYQDISKGVNKLLASFVCKILDLPNDKLPQYKEKILRYIYEKYIVKGYFYYGFSSCQKSEIDFSGIKKAGFILDSRVDEVNSILKKYEGRDIVTRVESDITDSFVVATYFAILGPDYLEKFMNSGIFNKEGYSRMCFYTKDYNDIMNNFSLYMAEKKIILEDREIILKNMKSILAEDDVYQSHGMIAFIKRSDLGRNYLKDIEEIIGGCGDLDIEQSIAMIMESRYSSYDIDNDISPLCLEFLDLPSYRYLCLQKENDKIDLVDEQIEVLEEEKKTNENGAISTVFIVILAVILIILIVLLLVFINRR